MVSFHELATNSDVRETVDLLVLGGDVVTMSPDRRSSAPGRGHPWWPIIWVGTAAEGRWRFGALRSIEAGGRIVLPGLVDTHFHTAQQLLRGKITELARRRQLKLPIWRNYLIPFESVLTEEDVYLSAQIAYANLLRVGTTCFTDAGGPIPTRWPVLPRTSAFVGLVAQSTMDIGDGLPPSMKFTTADALDRNASLIKTWGVSAVEKRVGAWLSLRQLLVCSRELWESIREMSDETGSRVHIHLAEGTYEVDYAAEHWGKRPAEYLRRAWFSRSPRPCRALDPAFAQRGRPLCRAGCERGPLPHGQFHRSGRQRCPRCAGVESASVSAPTARRPGSLDLFEAMRVSSVGLQTNYGTPWHDRSALSLEDLLEMATLGGATALGMGEHIGSLEVGKRADLVIANPADWDLQPVYDPMFTASRGLTGRDVETVVVDGDVVVDKGTVVTVDEGELRGRLAERWPEIMGRFESMTD